LIYTKIPQALSLKPIGH